VALFLKRFVPAVVALASSSIGFGACSSDHGHKAPLETASATATSSSPIAVATSSDSSARPEPIDAGVSDAGIEDERALEAATKEDILALANIQKPPKPSMDLQAFLDKTFGPGNPYQSNQGNPALAKHAISRKQCLAGLASITLQTEEQKTICGADNMVPIYKDGDVTKAKTCIDVFEFPNKACELPFVWIGATQAKMVCEAEGKRLCRQEEWSLACGGDPAGGPRTKYAYGDALDLDVCNTHKSAVEFGPNCDPDTVKSAWDTCSTNTEPTGAFPQCRSRFGVFDQHGNVAEIMTRLDVEDGHVYSQLKGSAFFYIDVARDENGKAPKGRRKIKPEQMLTTYPDICAHDPRWHVEPIGRAWHVNYHLGFRCCKSL
jgi:formylglycine-generating enzyme